MANWWEPSQSLTPTVDAASSAPTIRPYTEDQLRSLLSPEPTPAPSSLVSAMDQYRQARDAQPAVAEEPKADNTIYQ